MQRNNTSVSIKCVECNKNIIGTSYYFSGFGPLCMVCYNDLCKRYINDNFKTVKPRIV